jgi:PhnB protein
MPPDPNLPVPEEDLNKIMHVSLPIGDFVLMGSDSGSGWGPKMVIGNNFSLSISVDSKQEADNLHGKLSEGGNITMPMDDTFWEIISACVRTSSASIG